MKIVLAMIALSVVQLSTPTFFKDVRHLQQCIIQASSLPNYLIRTPYLAIISGNVFIFAGKNKIYILTSHLL